MSNRYKGKAIVRVPVDASVHRAAKVEAARRGVTLADVVRDALARFGRKEVEREKQ